MILFAFVLSDTLARCVPAASAKTMAAIVQVESGGNAIAIGDNTTGRSFYARNRATAERLARRLLRRGDSLDLGIAQINSGNMARLGLTIESIFDACTNLGAGARILSEDYARAVQRFGVGEVALLRALGMYNTGRLDAGFGYAGRVVAAEHGTLRSIMQMTTDVVRAARLASFVIPFKPASARVVKIHLAPEDAPIMVPLHAQRIVGM